MEMPQCHPDFRVCGSIHIAIKHSASPFNDFDVGLLVGPVVIVSGHEWCTELDQILDAFPQGFLAVGVVLRFAFVAPLRV